MASLRRMPLLIVATFAIGCSAGSSPNATPAASAAPPGSAEPTAPPDTPAPTPTEASATTEPTANIETPEPTPTAIPEGSGEVVREVIIPWQDSGSSYVEANASAHG